MFGRFKFYNLTAGLSVRGKCFGTSSNVKSTNESNERIAEQTNESNLNIQRETNAANIQMNEANNKLQQKLQEDMNAFNYRMWQENNEYNSFEQQIARGLEAGLNPNSVINPNVSSSPVQQVSTPPTTPGHADAARMEPYTLIPSRKDVMELVGEFAKQLNTSADSMGKFLANQAQSYVNDFAPAMLASDLVGKRLGNQLTKSNIKNVDKNTILLQRQAEGISQQINESKQKVKNMQVEWNNLSEDNYRKQIDNAFAFAMNDANLKNISADVGLKEANIKYLGNKMRCESMLAYANANHLNWQSEVLKLDKRYREEYLNSGGTLAELRQMESASNLYVSQTTGQDLTNDITSEMGKYQVRTAAAQAESAEYENSTFVRSLNAVDKIAGSVQKVGTGFGSVMNSLKPGVTVEHNNGNWVSTPTGRNPYE